MKNWAPLHDHEIFRKVNKSPNLNIKEEENLEIGKDNQFKNICGYGGVLFLSLGVFAPVVSMPMVGNINLFMNGEGDGVVILALALFSVFIIHIKYYKVLWITGIIAVLIIAYDFSNFQARLAIGRMELQEQLDHNPFRGLAETFSQSIQMQWGWVLLALGSFLIILSAALLGKK